MTGIHPRVAFENCQVVFVQIRACLDFGVGGFRYQRILLALTLFVLLVSFTLELLLLHSKALVLSLHPSGCLPLSSDLKAVSCLELTILPVSVGGIPLANVGTLILRVGIITLVGLATIGQIILAQPHLLLLNFATVLPVLSLLRKLRALQLALVLLREEIGYQAKTLGETIHPATGI
ncbi:hypothetical protein BFW91_00985 [Pseudomonas fluorescens]|nr:hypothetical protein BFW91_00985 [Pseudomonas fluorescens]